MKLKHKLIPIFTVTSIISNISLNSYAFSSNFSYSNLINTSNSLNTTNLDNLNIPIKDFNCSAKINEILSKIEYYLTEYKNNKNLIYLDKSIELFGDIGAVIVIDDIVYFEYNGPVYNAFEDIRAEIYKIDNEYTISEYIIKFGESILFGWRKNKISLVFPDYFLVEGLVEYNALIDTPCILAQSKLDNLLSAYYYMVNTGEGDTNSEEMPDIPESPPIEYEPSPPIDFDEGDKNTPEPEPDDDNVNIENLEDSYTHGTSYKKVGSTCVLVETKYKNGFVFEQTEKPLAKEDYVYCGIYDYIFDNVSAENTYNWNNTVIDEDYINNDQNEESNMYIFYTVSKDSFTPYYYNTGIRTTIEGSISYNQLKDALYQVAVKSKGFSTDTNDKSLSIIEGVPIVVYSNQDVYSKEYVEKLLQSFKTVGFKIAEEINESQSDLERLISENQIISIRYNDKDIQIDNLKIDNSFVMAPIETISMHFGYKTNLSDKELVISKEGFELKLILNESKYILNNEEFSLDSTIIHSSNEFYMDISSLFKLLGYNIAWDSDNLYFEVEDIN